MTPAYYRKVRKHLGVTQARLAYFLGVPREAINRRERGKQPITKEAELAILALAYVNKKTP